MSGYVEAGYVVAIGTLFSYGASLVARERAVRLRLRATARERDGTVADTADDPLTER